MTLNPVELTQRLIACASVTPADDGAQALLAGVLAPLGFQVEHLRFGDTPNLFARLGTSGPHLCFAGHTDVVPPGDGWRDPPFSGAVRDDVLYGRGACDMKGAIAAFVAAVGQHLQQGTPLGSVSLLITGDEEGPAQDGTVRVLGWMQDHGHIPDFCLVGEPTNPDAIGEIIKIGRRGSLNARITVHGQQGHVAYPDRADNPVHRLVAALDALRVAALDDGSEWFQPSALQITSVDVGNTTTNVIPPTASARLNIRFNDRHSGMALRAWLRDVVAQHAVRFDLDVAVSGEAFLTQPNAAVAALQAAVAAETGRTPRLDTGGGTSDARFIASYCPVAEFGLVSASMHAVDEHVAVADLHRLTAIYARFIAGFLAS